MTDVTELKKRVQTIAEQFDGTFGVAVKHFATGLEFQHNGEELYPLASVFKVPVLVELFRQAEQGQLDLYQRYEVRQELVSPGSGVLKEFQPGAELTLWDMALLMLIISDNTATDHVVQLVGQNNINPTLRRLGLEKTSVVMDCFHLLCDLAGIDPSLPRSEVLELMKERYNAGELNPDTVAYDEGPHNNVSSPVEMNLLLEKLVDPEGVRDTSGELVISPKGQDGALDIMKRQQLRHRIPYRLPRGTVVAHKTGTFHGVCNDCGIVFADADGTKPAYAISLMSKDLANQLDGPEALSRISLAVYEGLQSQNES
jgi:beta-lactamase class A